MADSPKVALRRRLLAARSAVPADRRAAEADALQAHLAALPIAGTTVCAYVPVGTEPGTPDMLTALRRRGLRVLLPAVADGPPAPLHWGEYHPDTLVTGRFGLAEPPPPWLAAEAVGDAAVVLVPALAVATTGARLGRGGGFYDRSLPLADAGAALVAVVRDDEVLAALPTDPHDVAMTHALTPGRGLVRLTREASGITPSD
ncbi:5-formyltetrahydrofolate cyclo-ligase [Mycolicibacillus koreensis]|nr:5-formyltetrahydrofolate cyclo-ligase [Mycolicibacillus koreensis]